MSILSMIRGKFARKPLVKRVIKIECAGFSVWREEEKEFDVAWIAVLEIVAFKEDLFSYDEICLGFRCDESESFLRVGEEDIGFDSLISEVESHFPALPEGWLGDVSVPAFKTNWTSIWKSTKTTEKKAAQPGATDNPDDAQRLREDH